MPGAAGTTLSLTISAVDGYGNTVTGYTGTVHFSSTDPSQKVALPGNYAFKTTDIGVHTFSGLKLRTAGVQTITVTDTVSNTVTGTWTINVT
jgi:hypothetical protein